MRKSYRREHVLSLGLLVSLTGTVAVQQAMAASAPPVFSPTPRRLGSVSALARSLRSRARQSQFGSECLLLDRISCDGRCRDC